MIEKTEQKIMERVGEYFYGYDDTTLVQELVKKLQEKELTVAAAESLTGGMFQQEITSIAGAGSIFSGGVVCYTNEVKRDILSVKESTINEIGVVSGQCAKELAENVQKLVNSDIGISFTGVAGPDELEGHPAGTVYIGIAVKGKPTVVEKLMLAGTREGNRKRTVRYGQYFILKALEA